MRNTFIIAMLLVAAFTGVATEPEPEVLLTKDVVGNRKLQLLSASIDETRAQRLVAAFAIIDDPKADPVSISFPSHSHTPHETTLMNIIESSVDWSKPDDLHQPHRTTTSVVFSIPTDARGYVTDFKKWWLVSMGPASAR